jgi:hypothetical protein
MPQLAPGLARWPVRCAKELEYDMYAWPLLAPAIVGLLLLAAAVRPINERYFHSRSAARTRDKAARQLFRQAKRQRALHAPS